MKNQTLRIVLAQLNFFVGDVAKNCQLIIQAATKAREVHHADLILFPELALTGYPPEDLLFRDALYQDIAVALETIRMHSTQIAIIVGYPQKTRYGIYNAAAVFCEGQLVANYHKQHLPNYSVFDEKRYFVRGGKSCVFTCKGIKFGLLICEDLWQAGPCTQTLKHGAELIVCINASPYDIDKAKQREAIVAHQCRQHQVPIAYVNLVGAQDDWVFDGGSFLTGADGDICQQAAYFEEALLIIDIPTDNVKKLPHFPRQTDTIEALMYQALVLGVKDYVEKNAFSGVFIGVSGGIDSALTLAIAIDALGPERVTAVLLPSRYTAPCSISDAMELINNLGVPHYLLSIEAAFEAFLITLSEPFAGLSIDTTEENIQARCRGVILMALANKTRRIVLTTGNKSELAVGYATLYGDMAGGFAVLKDVSKTFVYRLSHYRNQHTAVIPASILTREPTAELAFGQKDQDSLPPYAILDEIIVRYVELNQSVQEIINAPFPPELVHRIIALINKNEYKRRQAPLGIRVTSRGFGRERRYPITAYLPS